MKVLLTNHFPLEGSGSGIYTKNVALNLLKMGHSVVVIVPEHYHVQNEDFPVECVLFNNGKNQKYDLEYNFPCFTTHPKSNNTFYTLSSQQIEEYISAFQKKIEEVIKNFKPDIIHAQHLWIITYCVAQTGLPFVATVHGTDLMGYEKDLRYRNMVKEAVEKVSNIICISNQIKERVEELFPTAVDKLSLIFNGFDHNIFYPMEGLTKEKVLKELNISENPKAIVTFVGKLTHFKGVDIVLKAASLYEKEIPGIMTLIIGFGELYEELQRMSKELNLKGIKFLGHQDQKMVAKIYNISDVATMPSRKEPFGLVAIEALACGVPVVVTNEGGFPDFVNKEVGALVPSENPEELAKEIILHIKEKSKYTKGKYAAEYARKNFSWEEKVKDITKIYEDVIGGRYE